MIKIREEVSRLLNTTNLEEVNAYITNMNDEALNALVARFYFKKNEIDPAGFVIKNSVDPLLPPKTITTPVLKPVVKTNPKPFRPGDPINNPEAEILQTKKQAQEINDSTEFGRMTPEERAAMAKSDPDRLKRITQEWVQKMAKFVK